MQNRALGHGQLAKALEQIEAEVRDGLSHGHSELVIQCRVVSENKHELLVKAGKKHRFLITKDELAKP
jgi:hypothetical protein